MMDVQVRGETFRLLAEKCLFWPKHHLLAVADLHLGKSETFQKRGLWLPPQAHRDDLQKLRDLCGKTGAERVLFLGDLVHSVQGVTSEIRALFRAWCDEVTIAGAKVEVIIGNHDRKLVSQWPTEWSGLELSERLVVDGFVFQHEPPTLEAEEFHWVGHVHPVTMIGDGADRLRLPSFVIDRNTGLLPAFSSLAGGFDVKPRRGRKLYAIAGERVFAMKEKEFPSCSKSRQSSPREGLEEA
jgi:DNA ligase-associated metallophosphoesterase